MKTLRIASLLLLVGIFLGTAQPVLAQRGSETASGTFFDEYVTPKAKGKKVNGTLAITYVQKNSCCTTTNGAYDPNDENCLDPQIDMYYSFRLTTGKGKREVTYPFSAALLTPSFPGANDPPICFSSGTERQALAIVEFINDTVIPIIFQKPPVDSGFKSVWFIKLIENIVQPDFQISYDGTFCCGTTTFIKDINEFLMLDIELAVPQ